MKAKLDLVTEESSEAIEKAREMNMPEPDPEFIKRDLFFTLHEVNAAYVNGTGDIIIYHPAPTAGYWILDYDEAVWTKIKEHLESK